MSVDTPRWVRDAVFYQIFPDRFATSARVEKPGRLEPWDSPPSLHGFKGGDLLGIVERLDYLEGLGVTAIYMTPVFSSASNHRYHTYDYFQVDPLLGGDAALRELLDAAHARGMRVVLDGVFNHASRGFWPFHHVVETGASSPYRDWFYIDQAALDAGRPLRPYPDGSELQLLDAATPAEAHRAGDVSERHLGYRAWWDLPALPKLNTNEPHMREYLLRAAEHWLRFGIDGWRLDVAEEIDEGFWREFRNRVRGVRSDAYIVAEIWRERPFWLQGDHFDALMNYPFAYAVISFVGGPRLDLSVVAQQHEYRTFIRPSDGPAFAAALEHLATMYDPDVVAVQLNLLGSHDTARFLTVCGGDRAALRLATLVQMTFPGAPSIYYGDEIAMEGAHDPDCRRTFPADESLWDRETLAFVRGAVALRHRWPVLRHGRFRTLAADGMAMAYERADPDTRFWVVLNAGDTVADLSVPVPSAGDWTVADERWDGWWPTAPEATPVVTATDGTLAIRLLPRQGAVLRLRPEG
jgi:cyclomaltodextrinase / maltogenic alpha-amylase / neopullulanase